MPDTITLGITGGIAAYKSAELVRLFQQRGYDVQVVMTRSAEQFIRPLTFSALTGRKVLTSLWTEDAGLAPEHTPISSIEHIAIAQSTSALVVAPASANTLAKFAHGIADDYLSTLYLATTAPVILAPAMNVNMWDHPATQANLETLRARGNRIIAPVTGYLACGMEGAGRLADLNTIADAVAESLTRRTSLASETILITAGGTREPIDPVRFLGNHSSGKMGYALATAAASRGARVILIAANTSLTPPRGVTVVPVTTAAQMRDAVLAHLSEATIVFKAAAVADFRPAAPTSEKLRRNGPLSLTLEPTEDIAAAVAQHRLPGTIVIAFAAETPTSYAALLESARAKLLRKQVDAIVANDVTAPGLGFYSDRNALTLITRDTVIDLGENSKLALAHRLLDHALTLQPHHVDKPAAAR